MNANFSKEALNKATNDNSSQSVKNEFISSFIRFENDRGIVGLINDINVGKREISAELKLRLETWLRANEAKFPGLKITDIKKKDIESKLGKEIVQVNSLRTQLKSGIQSLYDIDDTKYESEIFPVVQNEGISKMRYILRNKQSLRKFVTEEIELYKKDPSKLPQTSNVATLLESFGLNTRWKNMNSEQQIVVYKILESLKNSNPYSDNTFEIEELLRIVPLTQDEKKALIEKYLPITNIQTLLDHGVVDKDKADKIRFNFVKSSVEDPSTSDQSIEKIASLTEFEDIIVETKKLSKQEIKKMVESPTFVGTLKQELLENSRRIEEKVLEESEKDIESFRKKLSETRKVIGAEKFGNGSILMTQTEEGISFAEVYQDSSLTGKIVLIDKGSNAFIRTNNIVGEGLSQRDFLKAFIGDNSSISKMSVLTKEEMEALIHSGKVEEKSNPKLKSRQEIEEAYESKKQELLDSGKTQQEIDDSGVLHEILHHNENTIAEFLDTIDPSGSKYGFKKGVILQEKGNDNSFWTIAGIDGDEVTLEDVTGKNVERISLAQFQAGCEQLKIVRVGWANSENDVLESVNKNDKIKKSWEGVKIKDGKLIRSEMNYDNHGHGHEEEKEIEYLVSKDGKEFIKILGFENGRAEVQFGTIEVTDTGKTDGNFKAIKNTKYTLEKKKYAVSYGFLEYWINKNDLEPQKLDGTDGLTKDIPVPHDHRNWSLTNWWVKGFSIANVLQGFHDLEHSIEHYFEGSQKEQAAKFAMKAFSILPYKKIDILGEIQSSLQADVEGEQKKRMEAQIQHLSQVDSKEAVAEIVHWLHYTNTPDYKIHAGMMFMIQKYGVLCAKGALADMKGDFIWYKALGGTPNDAFFKKVQRECEEGEDGKGIPFSEEELVYRWLQQLHRDGRARSRLHKEFKSSRAEGKTKEYDTGLKDGGDERGIEGRVKFTMGELTNGNYPNALGGLQKVYEKGGPTKLLEKVPFIIAFSGICYDFDGKWTLDTMKNFPSKGFLSPILRFLSYPAQMDQINKTILEVAKRMSVLENKPEIYKDALDIFNNRKRYSSPKDGWSYREKIKKTEKFYDKYGDKIMSALMLANAGDNVNDKYSGLIKIEKDDGVHLDGKEGKRNQVFHEYADTLTNGFISEYKFEAESVFDDLQRGNGLSGLDLYRIGVKKLFFQTGGKLRSDDESTIQLLEEIKRELETIGTRDYTGKGKDSKENKLMQKKIAKQFVRDFVRSIAHNHGTDKRVVQILNDPSSILSFFNKYDANFNHLLIELQTSEDDIAHKSNEAFERKLDEIAENITKGGTIIKKKASNSLESIIKNTKSGVNKASNDNDKDPWLDQVAT